jgi:transcription initiation factor TFIID TATA-box-binding protein
MIERIAETLEHTIYEPDIFPAVIYYHQSPRATMLIFRNGKLVITGVKSEDQAEDIYRQVADILTPAKLEEAQA